MYGWNVYGVKYIKLKEKYYVGSTCYSAHFVEWRQEWNGTNSDLYI